MATTTSAWDSDPSNLLHHPGRGARDRNSLRGGRLPGHGKRRQSVEATRVPAAVARPRRATILDHPNPLAQHPVTTRRISASYTTGELPSSYPTIATSSVTADSLTYPHAYSSLPVPATHHSRKVTPSTATTYTTATVAPHNPGYNKNVPATISSSSLSNKHKNSIDVAASKLRHKSKPRPALSTIPRSRTLNVFSNLTASISRSSLGNFSRTTSISSTAESESGKSTISGATVVPAVETSNPRHVHEAQSSAYWTGRFVALQDRFHSEMLLPENLTTLVNAHAERSIVPGHVPRSFKTMSASASNTNSLAPRSKHKYSSSISSVASQARKSTDAELLTNEENRSRRIFLHLEAMCTTSEAKKSLHAWQQTYARHMDKEELLPRGGTMEDKGWMGRLLGRNGPAGKRGSIASVA